MTLATTPINFPYCSTCSCVCGTSGWRPVAQTIRWTCNTTRISGNGGALSQHADEVFLESVDEGEKQATKKLFQALTEKGGDNRGIRRPTRLADLCDIVGAEPELLKGVIERFRKPGRTFLMPPVEVSLDVATVIDISHESLMRVWVNLRQWVETESQSARIFRPLG